MTNFPRILAHGEMKELLEDLETGLSSIQAAGAPIYANERATPRKLEEVPAPPPRLSSIPGPSVDRLLKLEKVIGSELERFRESSSEESLPPPPPPLPLGLPDLGLRSPTPPPPESPGSPRYADPIYGRFTRYFSGKKYIFFGSVPNFGKIHRLSLK